MKHHEDNYRSEDNRRPEEIEHDIERTRAELSSNIDAIQSKLTPGQMMDQAIGYARTSLPADFGSNLNHAVRENPIPVTLIGLGAAWLMASGRQRPGYMKSGSRVRHDASRDGTVPYRPGSGFASEHGIGFHGQGDLNDHGVGGHVTGDHDNAMHGAMSSAKESGRNLKNRASETTHNLKERVSSTAQGIKEKVSAAGQGIREKTSSMSRSVSDSSASMGERFSNSSSSMSDRSHRMAEDARMRASNLGHRSQEQYHRAKDNFSHMLEEQPLVLGVLGLAVGTLLGAMIPATRREDELMGHARDDLFERGQQMAREQAEHLKESAQRVAETAREEAHHLRNGAGEQRNGQSYKTDGADTAGDTGRGSQSLH